MDKTQAPKPIDILSLSRTALTELVQKTDAPFRAKQIWRWFWKHGIRSFDEMSNVPESLRTRLAEECEIRQLEPVEQQRAADGTIKFLFRLASDRHVETVLIPDFGREGRPSRMTVCVSSQVGCAMGCSFCATGLMGFQQNLTSGEIVEQIQRATTVAKESYDSPITNVVFMGMGEPLLNYDAVLDAIEKLTAEDANGHGG